MVVTHKDEALSYYLIFKISNYQIMKKTYIIPTLHVAYIAEELPIAQSNRINGNTVNLNPTTMGEGNGDDAVKQRVDYSVWNDDWSQ